MDPSKCHEAVSPDSYYAACTFDSCMVPGQNMECASLQNYAATCADQGVCIDWRGLTSGACPIHCAAGKVYKACGPSQEQTCKSGLIGLNQTQQIEGCFCPEGTMLYEAGLDVCVETCGCVGPDGIPRKFGEKFQFDCKDCICLEGGRSIICEPHTCPAAPDKTPCEGEGFHEVTQVNPDDKCCSHTVCGKLCNSSACTTQPPKCSAGFEVVADTLPGSCCPPGSQIFAGKCKECVCTQQQNSSTQLNIIHCDQVSCNVHCDPVSIRKRSKVRTTNMKQEGSEPVLNFCPHLVQAGERQSDPKNNCTIYSCQRINMQLISSTSSISCSPFNEEKCQPVSTCFICIFTQSNSPFLFLLQTRYSAETNSMQHRCSCCREAKATQKQVTLICPDGTRKTHSYLFVESCECLDSMCEVPWSSERTGKLTTQAEQRAVKRRRRAIK
uniref:CTCK domain-containing protein n=1 Tax=Varanus komodoensis TaxID=61221 RepID=A0A8D2IZQ5_VARKO